MFMKFFNVLVFVSAIVVGVTAQPVAVSSLDARGRGHSVSFNNWGSFPSLHGFDNFYGSDNFIGSISTQTVVEQESELICHSQSVVIIQQRLLVLQEMAKRIIAEQICEVETQTIVFEQFHASVGLFGHDLRRVSGRHVGFDSDISSHFNSFFEVDGSLSTRNFGFTGHDLGRHTVVVRGSNWNDVFSPSSVGRAYNAARRAFHGAFFH